MSLLRWLYGSLIVGILYRYDTITKCFHLNEIIIINILCILLLVGTHWGRVTHKCVSKLTIIGSDNGLSSDRHQAIIWTNAGILLIGPLGTNFSEILIEILIFSIKKMRLKVSSVKRRPFCLGLNVLTLRVKLAIVYLMKQSHVCWGTLYVQENSLYFYI